MERKYFEIKVEAKSKEELSARVGDNESRGFEVARYYEYEKEGNSWLDGGYRNRDGAKYRHAGNSSHKFYGAVMRRDNDKRERRQAHG
ncbi:hypothetical protein [Sporosarcina sp. FSL K6-1508]|uniref:hypothetical protein n=1 Tax=Sporosarcina sp. FSL K6-1508 TaxID=2921553 RepID=UPI0030F879CA